MSCPYNLRFRADSCNGCKGYDFCLDEKLEYSRAEYFDPSWEEKEEEKDEN